MLNYYQKNTVANHLKRSSLQQNSLNLSSKFYQSQNDKRSSYSHLYPRKAVSTDKHSYYNSKKSLSKPNSISANKQIQGKKLASSSQFYNSGSNINFNLIKGNNTFSNINVTKDKEDSLSYLNYEKKSNLTQTKEGIIRQLKTNYSTDKVHNSRKKNISLNTDFSQFINESLAGVNSFITETKNSNQGISQTEGKNESNYSKSNYLNNSSHQVKRDQPLKLYTENSNVLTTSSINNKSIFNVPSSSKIKKQINDIEVKMDKMLKENKTNSKSKKYNVLKHSFEELLRMLTNNTNNNIDNNINRLLQRLLVGYHEVVSAFSFENRDLKENESKMKKEYQELMLKNNDLNKLVAIQQSEIDQLKAQLSTKANSNEIKEQFSTKEIDINSYNTESGRLHSTENEKIIQLNKNNLYDLDALYFFDKVEMQPAKSSSSSHIPILKLGLTRSKSSSANNKGSTLINNNTSMLNMMKQKYKI